MLPNIIFIFAILGILIIILRHLPEAASESEAEAANNVPVENKLWEKGLPVVAISRFQGWIKLTLKKLWLFMLEAKDLKPTAVTGYKIKKLFRAKPSPVAQMTLTAQAAPVTKPVTNDTQEQPDEQYFLDKIKENPKDLGNYSALAKFYVYKNNFQEAADLYEYLVKHESTSAEFHSKLAYSYYRLGEYEKASRHYEQAIALDPTQPNRYYNLGVSLDLQNKTEAAIKAFERAIALEPKTSRYYISLAQCHHKLGELDRAKVILRQARKVDPGNPEIEEKLKQYT